VQREDGLFAIGWHDDAAGPFESREFAESVAAQNHHAQQERIIRAGQRTKK
jgi:hypothetical protein